ncbi:Transcriptional regulator in cluster with unspecified monosaccharide ABC transport system [Geobacillus proteiniphilus]|uniref:Transcriptional regulator in cluster with unspecified monosaccharide ABC transport system n=1 Tax=Geobacillus proteiniphilus TaxID=860353 RepID=A0A1Q5SV97_9BACL|nr:MULTISPECIES: helix-turn-helix domain-containing protein [Geobacillus]OKO91941.1 Transcriptional regulator in cluster with unspecified monosaccharide ABC transport system [Geobacillus proteiniphilus]OPX03313.1 helix-turn-helix domain-containing protein [Geobacillus sp. LEMMY01]
MTELGKRLREAREEKNMSLDELQEMTKIQKRYLIGIEEGNYAIMPGNFYVRAFIRQYAEAVGLDPDELFEQYKQDIPQSYQDDIPQTLSRVKTRQQLSAEGAKWLDWLPKVIVAVVVIGVAVLVWVLLQRGTANEPPTKTSPKTAEVEKPKHSPLEQAKEKEEAKKAEEKKGPEAEQPAPAAEEEKPAAPAAALNVTEKSGNTATIEVVTPGMFSIELSSKGTSWVEVYNTKGHTFYRGNLTNGQTKMFDLSAESEVWVKIGRTLDVEMKVNGQPFAYPFAPKEEVYQKLHFILKK